MLHFLNKFRRITYSTNYLPEIDGLRFLAIFSVVVIMHITHYIDEKFYANHLIDSKYWRHFVLEGGNGVALFFVISGFILSVPFARWRLNDEKKVSLKKYFLRRVTRLEPPYFIALIVFFMAHVWILHTFSFAELLPHFFASAAYQHILVYHSFSPILPVAWSLEVEVQFYILAPVFFLIFLIRSKTLRWVLSSLIIVVSAIYWYDVENVVHVFRYIFLFFGGILLADLYCSKVIMFRNQYLGLTVGLCALLGYFFLPSLSNMACYLIKIGCIFILVHTAITNNYMKKIFSGIVITVIGGMCYTIYLLHLAIISFVGQLLMKSGVDVTNKSLLPIFGLGFVICVFIISSVYFLLIEKPFMRPIGLGRSKKSK